MKILITGGTSATALKLLKAFNGNEIVLADYGEVPAFSSPNYQLISLGEKKEDVLAHKLLNQCLDHNIDAILPIHYFEIESLAKAGILFSEFNVNIMLPNIDVYELYLNSVVTAKTNWAIFDKGEIVFTTQANEQLIAYGKAHNLSGAFYFDFYNTELELSLITI